MRAILIQEDVQLVESRLKAFEASTGCELLMVVADAADPYPAASMRFGLISGFLISLAFSYFYEFHHASLWPISFFVTTLLMTWVGHFRWAKKFALSSVETKRECQEKALELFHSLGTSQVAHQVTAMIMVSVLERRIEVLVDEKLKEKITQEQLDDLVQLMLTHFQKGLMGVGLTKSIESLEEKILSSFNGKVSDVAPSQLKDTIHFITQ